MPELATEVDRLSLVIEIGGMPVRVHTTDPHFLAMLQERYAGFVFSSERAEIELDVQLAPPNFPEPDAPVRVTHRLGRWTLERGDFHAEWEPASRTGWIRQTANPYSIDAVLRIVHTLVLARQGGFLAALRQRHSQRQGVPCSPVFPRRARLPSPGSPLLTRRS